jgi:hypothetical protein
MSCSCQLLLSNPTGTRSSSCKTVRETEVLATLGCNVGEGRKMDGGARSNGWLGAVAKGA